jgi:hypothetical protein
MLSLSDAQLRIVVAAAGPLPVEKCSIFLERVAARLSLRGRFDDKDLDGAVRQALRGLLQETAA